MMEIIYFPGRNLNLVKCFRDVHTLNPTPLLYSKCDELSSTSYIPDSSFFLLAQRGVGKSPVLALSLEEAQIFPRFSR